MTSQQRFTPKPEVFEFGKKKKSDPKNKTEKIFFFKDKNIVEAEQMVRKSILRKHKEGKYLVGRIYG